MICAFGDLPMNILFMALYIPEFKLVRPAIIDNEVGEIGVTSVKVDRSVTDQGRLVTACIDLQQGRCDLPGCDL